MSDKVVKVKYEDVMTRLEVHIDSSGRPDISLHTLKSKIFKLFMLKGIADDHDLNLRYKDEDGDVVVIFDDEGFSEAFKQKLCPFIIETFWWRSEISFHNLGSFGGGGGSEWNDGNFEGINGITVTTSSESLLSIQVSYATGNDTTYTAPRHGGAGEAICTKFKYPSEKLRRISGYSGLVEGTWTVIKGLSFETNLAKYGPFGVPDWEPFEFDLRSTDVVGVYGRICSRYLGAIGLHTCSSATKTQLEK